MIFCLIVRFSDGSGPTIVSLSGGVVGRAAEMTELDKKKLRRAYQCDAVTTGG